MAVNELDRDYLKLLHMCDGIENIIGGMKMDQETDSEKKKQVGNMVMHLEMEVLDSKYTDAKKDLTRVNSTITKGRTYWKS
tara:strand:+ start:386 stop:628 length:243 start_codon:yes stop_codon:yes gene_type:complete